MSRVKPSQKKQPSRSGRLPRRSTDRIEDAAAWVLTAAALFVVLGSVLGGLGVYGDVVARGRAVTHGLTRVDAVLLTEGQPSLGQESLASRPARYRDPAGVEHDVVVTVHGRQPAGAVVEAWLDRTGRVTAAPPTRTDAAVLGSSAAFGIVALGALVLAVVRFGVRTWLDGRNAAAWAREWAEVEPSWTGRVR